MSVLAVRYSGSQRIELVATLKQTDLCDRCPAAAGVVVILPLKPEESLVDPHTDKTLLFCNHHYNKHEVKLAELGVSIYRKEPC